MELFPLLFGATCGIGVIAGILHLVIGLARPRSPVHLLFGLVAILVGIQAIFVYAISQATSLAEFVALWKYGYGLTNTFALPALLWFVALYTDFRPRRFLLGMTLFWFAFIVTPHFLLPTGIRINMVAIKQVTTSWGEQFTVHEGQPTAWLPVVTVWLLLYYSFCLYATYRQWRRGDRVGALALGVPLIPLTMISLFHGRLIDAGIIQSPSLGNVTFVLVIIPMSVQLAYDAVITKRALRENEQRLRAFVTHTQEGIWTVDFAQPLSLNLSTEEQVRHIRRHANRFSNGNDAMAHILGYENREAFIGRQVFDVFSRALVGNEALWQQIVSAGFRVTNLIGLARGHDGRERYLESSLTPILEDGRVIRVWGTSRDVTDRLHTAEELRQYREDLEEMVDARTAALQQANEQLSREVTDRKHAEKELREREALLNEVLDLLPVGVWLTDAMGQIVFANPAAIEIWAGVRYVGPEEFDLYKAWWADSGERISAEEWAGARAIAHGEAAIANFVEIEAFDGSQKFVLNSAVPLRDEENEIAGAIIVNEDVTARRLVEERLQRHIRQLEVLHAIAGTLATLSDLLVELPRVAETVTGLFQADSVHIVLSASADGNLILGGYEQESGPLTPEPLELTLAELPVARQVLEERQTLSGTVRHSAEASAKEAAILQRRDIESYMLVPLVAADHTVGVLAVTSNRTDRAFSSEEVQLAETIAADIAAAVANLHLLAQTRETAALQERQRIASDLHDSVTQTIYSVSILAQTVPRLVREGKLIEAEQNATRMRLATLGALAQMRTLLFELRPGALVEARLGALLQQLGDALTGQARVPVDLVVRGDGQPPADVKIAFYRIAQEALNNIAKHAQATQVAVTLHSATDMLEMTITDDGRGFDLTSDCPGCMGLRIMGERAAGVGAALQLDSQPGQGTTITLSWGVTG